MYVYVCCLLVSALVGEVNKIKLKNESNASKTSLKMSVRAK